MLDFLRVFMVSLPYMVLFIGMVFMSSKMYAYITKIDINQEIFVNKNYAVMISYLGYILVSMFIALDSMTGETNDSLVVDLLITSVYFIVSQVILVYLRVNAEKLIFMFDINHKDSFIHEIVSQKNYALALFETSIYVLVAGIITGYDFVEFNLISFSIYFLFVVLYLFASYYIFKKLIIKGESFVKELIKDDNPAFGILIFGYAIFVATILNQYLQNTHGSYIDIFNIISYFIISILVVIITQIGIRKVADYKFKVNSKKEIFENNNLFLSLLFAIVYINSAQLISVLF